MTEAFDEQMKKCESVASELSAQSGFNVCANSIWRACYAFDLFSKSNKDVALNLRKLRLAIIGRDGTKRRPFRFLDIANRNVPAILKTGRREKPRGQSRG